MVNDKKVFFHIYVTFVLISSTFADIEGLHGKCLLFNKILLLSSEGEEVIKTLMEMLCINFPLTFFSFINDL